MRSTNEPSKRGLRVIRGKSCAGMLLSSDWLGLGHVLNLEPITVIQEMACCNWSGFGHPHAQPYSWGGKFSLKPAGLKWG